MENGLNLRADVTVFILVYNDPQYIRRAIESVRNQTYRNIKIVLLDNGSTDETPGILTEYLNDPRISLVTNPRNQRSEFATRQALRVDTEFISFLFSDDWYETDRVEKMLSALRADPKLDAVFSNCRLVDDNGQPLATPPPTLFHGDISSMSREEHLGHFLFRGNSLHPCAMMIRSGSYRQLGGFPVYMHRIGDLTFFARLLGHGRAAFLKDELQNITVLKSQRNESAANSVNYAAVALERTRFLAEYRAPALLRQIKEIMPELRDRVSDHEVSALFWLGWRLFQIPAQDLKLFGMKCMYDAFDLAGDEIDEVCQINFGTTFSQYCYALHEGQQSSLSRRYFQLRRFVVGFPGGRKLIDTIRPFVR